MAQRKWSTNIDLPGQNAVSIAANASAEVSWTNDAEDDLIVTRLALPIWLAAAAGGAIVGSEVAHFPSPTAADNTHPTRALFRVQLENVSTGEKYSNSPENVASFLNPDGETYLDVPYRIPSKGVFKATLYNDSTVAVKAQLNLRGVRITAGSPWPQ